MCASAFSPALMAHSVIHLHAVTPHLHNTTDQNLTKLVGMMQLAAAFAIINKYE